MRRVRERLPILAVACLGLLVGSGCGGSDENAVRDANERARQAEERARELELLRVRDRARRAEERARGVEDRVRSLEDRGQGAPSPQPNPSEPGGGAGDVYDCRDFASQGDAQDHYNTYGDKDKLDRDGDGEVCETVFGEVPGPP